MKRSVIPLITTAVGMLLAFVLVSSGATAPGEEQALPLLMMLFMSELGFIISLGGHFMESSSGSSHAYNAFYC